jgi:hypothetical protein
MTSTNNEKSESLIKLTRAELMSQHVDELLQRQMNLRGERGRIETKRTWYYQNWFIFMVVGCIAAILAWAVIEPYFDDVYYIQGKIEEVQLFSSIKSEQSIEITPSFSIDLIGRIRIREDWIGISNATGTIEKGITKKILLPGNLEVNREIGVYVDYMKANKQSLPVALFVSFTTNPHAPEKAYMSLSKLNSRQTAASFLLFSLVAGFIGLAIGAVDGVICRVFKRALIGGVVGFFIGFIGGFFSSVLGGIVYQPLNTLAMKQLTDNMSLSTLGFLIQIIARTLAWGVVGMATGLGYGISLRSRRLILYGFIGGILGGLLGGMFFDPIDFLLFGGEEMSAHLSRLMGLAFIGAAVGTAIGIVELLSREAWLRMIKGSLAGKEFIVFKDIMKIGSSPKNEIYLFNDPQIKDLHAKLLAVGDEYEIESQDMLKPVLVNNRPVKLVRLHSGDQITIGQTSFIFEKREK